MRKVRKAYVASRAKLRLAAAAIVIGAVAAGCSLSFVQDRRVHIAAPKQASTVQLPVTLRWSVHSFRLTGPTKAAEPRAGYFAVLVDRNPMPPGASLHWFAGKDRSCRASLGCPNAEYLAERSVYLTSRTSLTLRDLPALRSGQQPRWHEVTIVLLDGTGHRIGESAFYVDFYLTRDKRSL